jgi:hypothetical protein
MLRKKPNHSAAPIMGIAHPVAVQSVPPCFDFLPKRQRKKIKNQRGENPATTAKWATNGRQR